MTEVIKISGIDKSNDYNSELAKINNDLSELKESILNTSAKEPENVENNNLPEGFEYDSDGCIVCKNSPFTAEDYDKQPTPIEKVLGGKIKEGEYRYIDYSECDKDDTNLSDSSNILFLKNNDSHIVGCPYEGRAVLIKKGMKIISPKSKNGQYCKFISYGIDRSNHTWADIIYSKRMILVGDLSVIGMSFEDLKTILGDDKSESEIFDFLKNSNKDVIDEDKKQQLFGDYSKKIEPISMISRLKRIKIKENLGYNLFFEYVSKFTNKLNRYNLQDSEYANFFDKEIPDFLLSPSCPITRENIDDYINCVNKLGHFLRCSIDDQKLLIYYNKDYKSYSYDYALEDTLKNISEIKKWKELGITDNMVDFIGSSEYDRVKEFFVYEKEGKNLFKFLSKYPQKLKNLGGREIKEIDLNTNERNFCFRGILEMMKSRGDMEVLPYPGENADKIDLDKWEISWEKVIKEYESFLRYYIGLDFELDEKGKRVQKDKSKTFDKIFYSNAVGADDGQEDTGGALANLGDTLSIFQSFSKNKVLDYSSTIDENGNLDQSNNRKLVNDICEYAKENPDQKILVYIGAHGNPDGSSGNGWGKEDWLKIAKYPNIKIMSVRCYFGGAYANENNDSIDYIYNQESTFSGFSNLTSASSNGIKYAFEKGVEKGLGFHEFELYTRLNYDIPSPLTDKLEYKNWKTGKTEKKNIGLAYEGEENVYENNA